jgi:hypothetical protein
MRGDINSIDYHETQMNELMLAYILRNVNLKVANEH